jgi:uncharacterized lipoprotein YehR (DUF1307 family)
MIKVIIEVHKGEIQAISSNYGIEYVVIDYSKSDIERVSKILYPDMVTNELSVIFPEKIEKKLKELGFE